MKGQPRANPSREGYGELNPEQLVQETPRNSLVSENLFSQSPKIPTKDALNPEISEDPHAGLGMDIDSEDHYRLSSTLLSHTSITEINMMKLKACLMLDMSSQGFTRDTYALATSYIDLFFQKKAVVSIQQFQNFGMACFIIAAKVVENRLPPIPSDVYNREQLFQMEKLIIQKLEYRLNPKTYVELASNLMFLWDQFVQMSLNSTVGVQPIQYLTPKRESAMNSRRFFERLDCMAMVLKSHDFKMNQLVLNAFFVQNRINNLRLEKLPTTQQIRSQFYDEEDEYFNNFVQFLNFANWDECEPSCLNVEIGVFVAYFLPLQIDPDCSPSTKVYTLLHYLVMQTYNKKCQEAAKAAIVKQRRQKTKKVINR